MDPKGCARGVEVTMCFYMSDEDAWSLEGMVKRGFKGLVTTYVHHGRPRSLVIKDVGETVTLATVQERFIYDSSGKRSPLCSGHYFGHGWRRVLYMNLKRVIAQELNLNAGEGDGETVAILLEFMSSGKSVDEWLAPYTLPQALRFWRHLTKVLALVRPIETTSRFAKENKGLCKAIGRYVCEPLWTYDCDREVLELRWRLPPPMGDSSKFTWEDKKVTLTADYKDMTATIRVSKPSDCDPAQVLLSWAARLGLKVKVAKPKFLKEALAAMDKAELAIQAHSPVYQKAVDFMEKAKAELDSNKEEKDE